MNRIWKFITSRVFVIFFLIFIEALLLLVALYLLGQNFYAVEITLYIFSLIIAVYVVNRDDNPAYKLAWVILIMGIPLAGWILYLLFGKRHTTKEMRSYFHYSDTDKEIFESVPKDIDLDISADKSADMIFKRLKSTASYSFFCHTKTEFLSPGQVKFKRMIEDLKAAERFIFLEYFIITPGHMWGEIVEILVNKAKKGVDVRLIYDDFGTVNTLPSNYFKILRQSGIKTQVFNKLKPRLNAFMNNRDHRKILVIDGDISYTGGINLADEYINKKERFGYWKDASIRLYGEASMSLCALFLTMWHYLTLDEIDFNKYKPQTSPKTDGVVAPFGDNPASKKRLAESIYLQIVQNAKEYVYIETPYLVMDNELTTAIILAAQSGVDVKIVTPHIPDKFYVFALTRDSYKQLIEGGVKIYEYTPGFIHSKVIISDDKIGVVGTANFDFRSLYLHFECGVLLYKTESLVAIKEDFNRIIDKSHNFTLSDCSNIKKRQKALAFILKPFAPLM